MTNVYSKNTVEIWGGIECTINRVGDRYLDQCEMSGHYIRGSEDLKRAAAMGISAMRYPILWERHAPDSLDEINWHDIEERLIQLSSSDIEPIAGLVHHGSGPRYVNFFNGSFEEGLAEYATAVAKKFPWIQYYTPVNEPLTTARFCGLYGLWYPHGQSDKLFLQILVSECKATVLAMQRIREINPQAKLVQTEDLGKIHSTPLLRYQGEFENLRRWLSFDLLCGRVNESHGLWKYLIANGMNEEQLEFFVEHPCPPDIVGVNHYLTSERWLDERLDIYPSHTHGGNGKHVYADVEAVRVGRNDGALILLREAWQRYHLPMAVTEVHLHCTREEQLRWIRYVYDAALKVKAEGADIRAVTAWAMLGSFDWCNLLTHSEGNYEPGLFDIRSNPPRPTALHELVSSLAKNESYHHPVLQEDGWWQRPCAILYDLKEQQSCMAAKKRTDARPLVIIGKTGTLGTAFKRLCELRGIYSISLGRNDINIFNEAEVEHMIGELNPWALINTAGFVRVDDAETASEECFLLNSNAPKILAALCGKHNIQFVTYSSDLVFDGKKNNPYLESDMVSPLNVYGQSKALAEEYVLNANQEALIIRTSAFFGPWDAHNFAHFALKSLKEKSEFAAAGDVVVSPTYVPDLVNTSLDLLLDKANGIWNLTNRGAVSWFMLAEEVAKLSRLSPGIFKQVELNDLNLAASRPRYSVLNTEKGWELPPLENALERFLQQQEVIRL